ncbi:transposase [Xanthomonas citri pv. malvacearum]|nr:transposase [Xanthomonas citri pv. malvacearum]
MKKRFSEEQIIGFLREAEAGIAIKDLCRRHGFSEASYYLWRSKFGGMSVPDAKRLKDLEAENARLEPPRDFRRLVGVSHAAMAISRVC